MVTMSGLFTVAMVMVVAKADDPKPKSRLNAKNFFMCIPPCCGTKGGCQNFEMFCMVNAILDVDGLASIVKHTFAIIV
ncbi:hypothetical protein GCM10008938_49500 [Deinococcus roseus]|uniref:Uncharacterized protein n=1 Tax=Deinococcus roseus TaxID=392414 RepID=A0ABQ2DIM7_9DEIO|nr:hypothetical protein GCM10008938_49500 [Deinococcus roseus]